MRGIHSLHSISISFLGELMSLFADRISLIDTENAFKVGPQIAAIEANGNDVVKLNLGEPDFNIPEFIKDEIKLRLDQNWTHYCDPSGIKELREAIAEQLSEKRKITVTPDRVVLFPGAKPSIGLCQQAYVNPGDEVIYPTPGFPIYESFVSYVGGVPKPLIMTEEHGFSCTSEQLAPLISEKTKLIILNFPSNPTGGVATEEQLKGLADLIRTKAPADCRIYADEIYEYIVYDGETHRSIATQTGMAERTIISSGFSKTFAWTGGRIGFAAFPTVDEAQVFRNLNINYFSCLPPYNQFGAVQAYTNPGRDSAIKEMVQIFEKRRNLVVDGLNKIDGISCLSPGGAFYAFPNIEGACERIGVLSYYETLEPELQKKSSPATLFQLFALYKHHVATMDRLSFGRIGSEGQHYLRLSFAASNELLEKGIDRIASAASDADGFKAFTANHQDLWIK